MMRHLLQYIVIDKHVVDMLTKPMSGTSFEWSKCFFSPIVRSDMFLDRGK
jgi:hypothetical protein